MDRKKLMDQMMETFFSDMHRRCVLFDIVIFPHPVGMVIQFLKNKIFLRYCILRGASGGRTVILPAHASISNAIQFWLVLSIGFLFLTI
jgi:hypothetical protein